MQAQSDHPRDALKKQYGDAKLTEFLQAADPRKLKFASAPA